MAPSTLVESRKAEQYDPKLLRPHPQNPRGPVTKAEVEDLAKTIGEVGQLQPGLVRPLEGAPGGKKFELVIGHRRAKACEAAGRAFLAFEAELDDATALAIMLLDNESTEAPDPLKESEGIAGLLALPGWTLEKVAAYFGKAPSWVASRANLRKLEEGVRAEVAKLGWPVDWMEELAKVLGDSQKEAFDRCRWVRSRAELERNLAGYLSVLGSAPWDLEDPGLVPEAGACSACPKQSSKEPGLFGALRQKDLRKAVCRDLGCWAGKREAVFVRALAGAREKHPDARLVLAAGTEKEKLPEAFRELVVGNEWAVKASKKGAKGAELGLLVDRLRGKVTAFYYSKPPASRGVESDGRPKKKTLAEMKPAARRKVQEERLEERRGVSLCQRWQKVLAKKREASDLPKVRVLWGLAVAYGLADDDGARLVERKKSFDIGHEASADHQLAPELWERLSSGMARPLEFVHSRGVLPVVEEVEWQAEVLGWKDELAELRAAVEKEFPEPKGWSKGKAAKE